MSTVSINKLSISLSPLSQLIPFLSKNAHKLRISCSLSSTNALDSIKITILCSQFPIQKAHSIVTHIFIIFNAQTSVLHIEQQKNTPRSATCNNSLHLIANWKLLFRFHNQNWKFMRWNWFPICYTLHMWLMLFVWPLFL